jgi:hypothetical protein
MEDINNERALYSAKLIFEGIHQSGFTDEVIRLYLEITNDFSNQLLEKPRKEFQEIDRKRIQFEGISLLTSLYFFNELPKVIRRKALSFFSRPDADSLYEFREKILQAIKSELDNQGYSRIRDVNISSFNSKTGSLSFGVASPLDIFTRVEMYSKYITIKDVSKKFTMKLAYAVDPDNIVVLQTLGPIFIGPFQKMAELILNKVFET